MTGGNLRIEAGEIVHDVTIMGGNLDVYGTVTGDISVAGGNVRIHRGGHVLGDAAGVGGNLTIDSGAAVDGDVGVVGGNVTREDGARVGGTVHEGMRRPRPHKSRASSRSATAPAPAADSAVAVAVAKPADPPKASLVRRAVDGLHAVALFFVFGAVLLALAPDRMERLKVQVAAHPMRTFATGIVAIPVIALLSVAIGVTVIGLPVVAVGLAALLFGTLAGACSVLETLGGALLAHRTKNPYVHLAFGALLVLIAEAPSPTSSAACVKLAVFFTALRNRHQDAQLPPGSCRCWV